MHILVTGGAGFIGSHVVDALIARGDTVTVLDDLSSGQRVNINPKASFVEGDVTDATLVERLIANADAVIHLAAIASVQVCEAEPERAARVNVTATEHVFRAAAARGITVVYASSAAVYGDNPHLPLMEDAIPHPLSHYGHHKLRCETIAASHQGRVASVGLRFFNVYGPRQDPRSPYSGVISIFAATAAAGQPLTFYGDGEQTRDFIYISDVVTLILNALTLHEGTHILNGCTGHATSLKQLAAGIAEVVGAPIRTQHAAARSGDIRHSLGSPEKAKYLVDFKSKIQIYDGLRYLLGAR